MAVERSCSKGDTGIEAERLMREPWSHLGQVCGGSAREMVVGRAVAL